MVGFPSIKVLNHIENEKPKIANNLKIKNSTPATRKIPTQNTPEPKAPRIYSQQSSGCASSRPIDKKLGSSRGQLVAGADEPYPTPGTRKTTPEATTPPHIEGVLCACNIVADAIAFMCRIFFFKDRLLFCIIYYMMDEGRFYVRSMVWKYIFYSWSF